MSCPNIQNHPRQGVPLDGGRSQLDTQIQQRRIQRRQRKAAMRKAMIARPLDFFVMRPIRHLWMRFREWAIGSFFPGVLIVVSTVLLTALAMALVVAIYQVVVNFPVVTAVTLALVGLVVAVIALLYW